MQLLKDIYLTAGPFYGQDSAVFVVSAGSELILVDCGLDQGHIETIEETIQYWGLSDIPLKHAFLTHAHFDHSGNARYFEEKGVRLYAGKDDAEAIMTGNECTIGFAFQGKRFQPCQRVETVRDSDQFQIGSVVVEAIAVPGHTRGSMLYRVKTDGKNVVFAGDFVIVKGNCEDAILGWNGSPDYDEKSYFESIRKVQSLEADVLLCGHGIPCLKNGTSILNMLYKEALVNLSRWSCPR
jgi:glyoxylase-like metal-dependent hydrolase (beta-lactamase superfamily II)